MMGLGTVLLVEDNSDDVDLTIHAFRSYNLVNEIVVAEDGAKALEYLFANGAYADRNASDLPSLILLDLHLPKIEGLEVLKTIRNNPLTKAIPVVIMTSSDELRFLVQARELNVVEFIRKPVKFREFFSRASTLGMSWFLYGNYKQLLKETP